MTLTRQALLRKMAPNSHRVEGMGLRGAGGVRRAHGVVPWSLRGPT